MSYAVGDDGVVRLHTYSPRDPDVCVDGAAGGDWRVCECVSGDVSVGDFWDDLFELGV